MTARRVLYWFRTDLRIHDSPALRLAVDAADGDLIEAFYPIWCWDTKYVWKHNVGVNRWNFLLEFMSDLSASLRKLDPKHELLVVRGSLKTVLPVLWQSWGITDMHFEKDTATYARHWDSTIRALATKVAPTMRIHELMGHNLMDPNSIVSAHGDKPVTTHAGKSKKHEPVLADDVAFNGELTIKGRKVETLGVVGLQVRKRDQWRAVVGSAK